MGFQKGCNEIKISICAAFKGSIRLIKKDRILSLHPHIFGESRLTSQSLSPHTFPKNKCRSWNFPCQNEKQSLLSTYLTNKITVFKEFLENNEENGRIISSGHDWKNISIENKGNTTRDCLEINEEKLNLTALLIGFTSIMFCLAIIIFTCKNNRAKIILAQRKQKCHK